ncbi:hypothetical protein ODZ83_08285 [Acaricomes phytoseiuli]|uniref:hypothetical protein n=1 Tax=Acaricomes phytoseiuli TaxID=291968 RepID=UPI00037FD5C0|nr:hypothetical protein [Acaricomes phytoseiuli]MCW1250175.1 hypothetical protein [Acaricomes phytoseiuli]
MRGFLAALTGMTALMLVAVSVPALWVDRNLSQRDGFVEMAMSFAEDADFQSALSAAIGREVTDQLQLPSALSALVQPAVSQAADAILQDPGYPEAWAETLRRTHDLTVVNPEANANDSKVLNLDIAPLLQLVATRAGQMVGQDLQVSQQVLITVGSANQRNAIVRVVGNAAMGWVLILGAILAFLLSLLVARRRSAVLIWFGIGLAVVAGLWKLGLEALSGAALNTAGSNQLGELFKQEYVFIASASMNQWILVTCLIAVSLLLAGALTRVISYRRAGLSH